MLEEIKKMPKIVLHLHLDGSVKLSTALKLSNLTMSEVQEQMVAGDKCPNLTEYLTKFDLPISLMQTKNNLKLIARELGENLKKENVIYAEIRFAPIFHTRGGLSCDEVVEAVLDGLSEVPMVKTNLILCFMRGLDLESNLSTLKTARKYFKKGVCALDLAGDELKYPLQDYQTLLKQVGNIPLTIHAGETFKAQAVKQAIAMGAQRIGHGIKAINDEETLDMIKKHNILLELCPTSNVQTNAVDTYVNHPILKFYQKGVPISINTDNNTVSNISLNAEYFKLYQTFHFTLDDFKKINLMALNHAFISPQEKELLYKKIQ